MTLVAKKIAAAATRGKHFTLYAHLGPNPWKVLMLMYELGFRAPEDINIVFMSSFQEEYKKAPYTDLNPNGKVPTLIDHDNNDFVIWESGAIVLYLVEKYDKENRIGFEQLEDRMEATQWLMFQMSGQGPYWSQTLWFSKYSAENVPSAIKRYANEFHRILGVLDRYLEDREYLVQNRPSYADLCFLAWFDMMDDCAVQDEGIDKWRETYKNIARWHKSLNERPAVKEAAARKQEVRKPYLAEWWKPREEIAKQAVAAEVLPK